METIEKTTCPLAEVMRLIGGKWKPIILHHLLIHKTQRFGELKKRMPGVTQKMLTAQLRSLEADGLIEREVYPVVPPKVEYSLSVRGISLKPVLLAMKAWESNRP